VSPVLASFLGGSFISWALPLVVLLVAYTFLFVALQRRERRK
jgi:cytochrome c-type biogenesis protein CcmH/NrfF